MPLQYSPQEILETIRMVQMEKLDIRTITMGISLRDCAHQDLKSAAVRAYDKICRMAARLVAVGGEIEREYGMPIVNQRISVTPVALVAEASRADDYVLFAEYLDQAAREVGVNFIGGFSALVHKGMTRGGPSPHRLHSPGAGHDRAGLQLRQHRHHQGRHQHGCGRPDGPTRCWRPQGLRRDRDGIGCAKLVIFCNAVEDNPFMAGAFHGIGEPDCVINVGVSGPGVVLRAIEKEPRRRLRPACQHH